MCGRYTLIADERALDREFELIVAGLRYARYNIAPTQSAPVVRANESGERFVADLRWGLIPFWAKEAKIGARMINARGEEAANKPAFRVPFRKQRCLVPCSGFYEWKIVEGGTAKKPAKQPYYIRRADEGLFALAGLWDRWVGPEGPVESFSILTTKPNELISPLHDRMAVIIPRDKYGLWLDPKLQNVNELVSLVVPFPSDQLCAFPVITRVNSPRFDDPACMQPAA